VTYEYRCPQCADVVDVDETHKPFYDQGVACPVCNEREHPGGLLNAPLPDLVVFKRVWTAPTLASAAIPSRPKGAAS